MGSVLSGCQWLFDEGSPEYKSSNALMLASRKPIKSSRIPLSQLCLSDVILENETEDVGLNYIPFLIVFRVWNSYM